MAALRSEFAQILNEKLLETEDHSHAQCESQVSPSPAVDYSTVEHISWRTQPKATQPTCAKAYPRPRIPKPTLQKTTERRQSPKLTLASLGPDLKKAFEELFEMAKLVLPTELTKSDAKRAYWSLASRHHPDRSGGDPQVFFRAKGLYELVGRLWPKPSPTEN